MARTATFALSEAYRRLVRQPLMRSFSQDGEDLVIDRLLERPREGFYVDVGANDPVRFSNTARFYRRGWNGINVEPDPGRFAALRRARPRDVNLDVGIAADAGRMTFFRFVPDTLSTFSREEAERLMAQGANLAGTTTVPVQPLRQLLAHHDAPSDFAFLSVDTEGLDLEVLESNDWDRFRPRVVCVETTGHGEGGDRGDPLDAFLARVGYRLRHEGSVNRIYASSGVGETADPRSA
jgi:FkbM family methyltransferase